MQQACHVPSAAGAALMPDAHVGYGLPIGGVLALENAVIPYAVGVDIACRMKLSVLDMPVDAGHPVQPLQGSPRRRNAIRRRVAFTNAKVHPVMDQDWTVTRITREKKDTAWTQLGTSGSGNHSSNSACLTLPETTTTNWDSTPGRTSPC